MKKGILETQYDAHAENFKELSLNQNEQADKNFALTFLGAIAKVFTNLYPPRTSEMNLLDLGCGPGADFVAYNKDYNFKLYGVDASVEMCALARKTGLAHEIIHQSFTKKMPFRDGMFHVIVSKWTFQTCKNTYPIYRETIRILRPGGLFMFLVVHPFRQFLEKKKVGKNYFKQQIVASEIFDRKITVHEPTHTMQDYLSVYFLRHFELIEVKEDYEFPAAEQIGGDIYPTYLIVVARKK